MQDHESVFIISLRVGDKRALIVPGATKVPCRLCKHETWLSPRTAQTLPGAMVICDHCSDNLLRSVAISGEKVEIHMTPASLAESLQAVRNHERRN